MEVILLCLSSGLLILGASRFIMFQLRLKKYVKTRGTITNYEIETKYFSTGGVEVDRDQFNRFSRIANWKRVNYYSPDITYHAIDGNEYCGTWWIELPNGIPHNIGELVDIYYNPKKPGKFFMYDRVMMLGEPLLLLGIGLAGVIFMLFQLI